MLNIVVPMAGLGSRFSSAGFADPKPLISVFGRPMIQVVIENLKPQMDHQFIFICQNSHLNSYPLQRLLNTYAADCKIISIDGVTEGAACTVLLAEKYINNSDSLMIANCDQFIHYDINEYLTRFNKSKFDGYIMTMFANDPKWSFIGLDSDNRVLNVVEKKVISNEATVGIYNYKRGSDFVSNAKNMILRNIRVNNEFYVAPVYNEFINNGGQIGYLNIGVLNEKMFGIGTPEDLNFFQSNFSCDLIK
jgi:dTDP-glucose pyrophosphorylase